MEMAMAGPHFHIVKCGESGRLLVRAMVTPYPDFALFAFPLGTKKAKGKRAACCTGLRLNKEVINQSALRRPGRDCA
jgi:hypothetical protein